MVFIDNSTIGKVLQVLYHLEAFELVTRPISTILKDEAVIFSCTLIGQPSGDQVLTLLLCLGGRTWHTVALLCLRFCLTQSKQGGGWEVRQNSGRNASDSLLNSVSA